MRVFLDFEASSLAKNSYPIEVAWVFEDGRSEAYLIRPAPGWDDWADDAETIHHISRAMLRTSGTPHDEIARRMIDELSRHDLLASAPSWDGKWLSVLLRSADLPRHALRLRDSDDECRSTAEAIFRPSMASNELEAAIGSVIAEADRRPPGWSPAHRALADAIDERSHWLTVRLAAARKAAEASHAGRE
jgi:hypothetical protein